MTALVDEGRCTGCGICVDGCPERAISLNGLVVVDATRCTGCGACIAECPREALSLGRQTSAPEVGVTG